ncbi:hypothetical protein I4U23_003189 [Adineta vaga]|nr:hypothetical protein I4U23_003189 [Adineta vaga]
MSNPSPKNVSLFFHACAQIGNKETLTLVNAEEIFPKVATNTLSYGNLMTTYNENNQPNKTLDLYEQMKRKQIKLDSTISFLLINACAALGIYSICQSIFEQIPKSFLNNIYIKNALIDMWGKLDCIDKAKNMFDLLAQPDTVGYTSMINSYGLNGMGLEAIELFYPMPSQLILEETYDWWKKLKRYFQR